MVDTDSSNDIMTEKWETSHASAPEYAFPERERIVDAFYIPKAELKTRVSVVECIIDC
jgi:hypothetical protein